MTRATFEGRVSHHHEQMPQRDPLNWRGRPSGHTSGTCFSDGDSTVPTLTLKLAALRSNLHAPHPEKIAGLAP